VGWHFSRGIRKQAVQCRLPHKICLCDSLTPFQKHSILRQLLTEDWIQDLELAEISRSAEKKNNQKNPKLTENNQQK